MKKQGILVTSIGSFSAEAVVDSLLESDEYRVVGCDIYPREWHAVSEKFDAVYLVSPVSDQEKYLDEILNICHQENINVVLPLTDIEIDFLDLKRERFAQAGVDLYIQSSEVLKIVRDKYALNAYFKNDPKVNSIPTYPSGNCIEKLKFPCFAKPRKGRSSEGVTVINNEQELQIIRQKDDYIIQEFVEGNVYTVDYVRSSQFQQDFSLARKELLRTKNGAGLTVEVGRNDELQALTAYIGRTLNVNGCVNIEYICCEDKYYMIDINPRFSAGIAFSRLAGYDMVKNHLCCFQGRPIHNSVDIPTMICIKKMVDVISRRQS